MIFVDSSIIIACFAKQDSDHLMVKALLEQVLETQHEGLISSHDVIIESLNWIAKRCTRQELLKIASILISGELIAIQELNKLDWLNALKIIEKYQDQKLSFTDAVSFAMIQRLKIKHVLSLDSDFDLLRTVVNLAHGARVKHKDFRDIIGLIKDLPPGNYSEKIDDILYGGE